MEESKNLTCKRKVTDSFCCSTSINKEEEEEEEDSLYLPKELWVLIIRILHESFCSLKQTQTSEQTVVNMLNGSVYDVLYVLRRCVFETSNGQYGEHA